MLARWLKLHHTLGLLTCVGLLLWGLSGVIHPVMSRLQPRPAAVSPPTQAIALHQGKALPDVLQQHRLENAQVHRIGLAHINSLAYYRIATHDAKPARYFSIMDGAELNNGDVLYAQALAQYFTGHQSARILSTELVTEFGDDYLAVNRLLPVWRVRFEGDEGLRAFVDTDQARLSTLVDNTKHALSTWFRVAHTWRFLDSYPRTQVVVMGLLLIMGLFSSGSGLYFYYRMRKTVPQRLAKKPLARWHRHGGLVVALSTIMFTSSGAFHVWTSFQREQNPRAASTMALDTAQISATSWQAVLSTLSKQPIRQLHLIGLPNQELVWLARLADNPEKTLAIEARTGKPYPKGVLGVSNTLAAAWSSLPQHRISTTEHIAQFDGEYGFINKRLPVVRVTFDAHHSPRYYVELATASLAAHVTDVDALEGASFAYLHKWHFMGNKDVRDSLLALFALLNVCVALCGMVLYWRKK